MTERLPPTPEPLTPEERALAARLARLGPHGEPSPALDARILAMARAGVPAAAVSPRRQARWPLALGIAASVTLAVGLAWQLRPLPEPVAYDEADSAVGVAASAPAAESRALDAMSAPDPAPGVAMPAEAPAAGNDAPQAFQRRPGPARQAATKPGIAGTGLADAEPRQERAPPAPPAPPPPVVLQAPAPAAVAPEAAAAAADMALPPPPPAAPAAASAKTAAPASQAIAREAAARDAAAARARNATATSAAESRAAQAAEDSFADEPFVEDVPPATADSPAVRDAWLHRIRELRASGDIDAARASLREFVRRYPAFPLPDDLRPLLD